MKLLNGILLVLLIMTSCSQELNHSEDWMNQVDLMISEYNENAKIELNIENKHPKFTGGNSNTLFKNNKEGLFKLKFIAQ